MLKKDKKIQNIGSIINFSDYTPSNPNTFYNTHKPPHKFPHKFPLNPPHKSPLNPPHKFPHKRTHKVDGFGSIAMHYIGMGMMGGVFIGGIASGIKGTLDVQNQCDHLKYISNEINNIQDFQTNELIKRKLVSDDLYSFDYNELSTKISGIQTQIINENKKYKQMIQMNHIINIYLFYHL